MWWFYGIYFLVAGGALLASSRQHRQMFRERLEAFQNTARCHGLQVVVHPGQPRAARALLEAKSDLVTVRVESIPDRKSAFSIVVILSFPGPPGFSGVRIRPEKDKPAGARELEVGDARFDKAFFIEGPTRLLTMLLDAEMRRLLVQVSSEGQMTIAGGEIRVETLDHRFADVLALLLDLARRLGEDMDVAQRLAGNARQDSVAEVRLRNLLVLTREFPGDPGTLEALRAACSDASPRVRLRAAMALGAEGRDVLTKLAESLEDDDCSAQAVAHLGRELPFERTRALLAQALRRRRLQTIRACLDALGQSGDAASVDMLAKVLEVEQGDLAVTAALALGATGSPAAEPPLLEALQHEKLDLRVAAAQALGRVGTAAAVLPLKEAAGPLREQELRRATRQAIAEIQSRLQGASPGQLSLAGADAGRLSLADTEAGQLSLATDPTGQLSLPPESREGTSPGHPIA